jgi:hypothetical protein
MAEDGKSNDDGQARAAANRQAHSERQEAGYERQLTEGNSPLMALENMKGRSQ